MNPTYVELANGDIICVDVIEITAIPDVSITTYSSEEDVITAYSELMCNALGELSQLYRSQMHYDLAAELLWLTEPVKNQTYNARIRMFMLFRCIVPQLAIGKEYLMRIHNLFVNALDVEKYSITNTDYEVLRRALVSAETKNAIAIAKEGHIDTIQSASFPQCFTYDCFCTEARSNEILINTLLRNPNAIVSFQLIPTVFTQGESFLIDSTCQALGMLSRGMQNPTVGNVVFESAHQSYATYSFYNANKSKPLFQYNICVFGNHSSIADISSSLRAFLRGNNSVNTQVISLDSVGISFDDNYYPIPWIIQEHLIDFCGSTGGVSKDCSRLPLIISAEEATNLFGLPVGSPKIKAGFTINESQHSNKQYADNLINSGDITVGVLKSSNNQSTIGISLRDLTKHMLVVGTPGSGKTTFSVSLLDRLWKDHKIPFLVIEPAKNEYRALVQSIPDLQIFTPGKNLISPFVFNPFVPPKNVKLETYKSTLKTAFSAAVSMSTPLDKIFEETINNCYSDFRWLDTYTVSDKGEVFNISDFIKCFQQTFDEIGYTGDARNIGRAGVVRLNSLVNLFDNYYSIPIEDILKKPTVIELAAIENSDQKALIIALLLLSILAYVNANYIGEGDLKNVILLEEAHVLLDADTNTGQGEANPSAIAQSLVKRMLAEIRSYGVGIVIADQSPRKVSADVVALTDMKMVFRLVEHTDKTIIGDSTNMSDAQIQRMSRLKPGEAFLFFNRLDEPEEVCTPDYRLENKISITLSDESIQKRTTYWKDRKDLLRPYPQCKLCKYCVHGCNYERRILAREVARRIFTRYFRADTSNFEPLEKVLAQISRLVVAELNDEPFSAELLLCVKVHLWRKIKYSSKIPIKDIQIRNSLSK